MVRHGPRVHRKTVERRVRVGYKEQPIKVTEFFGKKTTLPVFKRSAIPEDKMAKPKSAIMRLVFWRWDWRGPGGYAVGKLEGSSTMKRVFFTLQEIEEKYVKIPDGRFFQTGYDDSPSNWIKKAVTVKDICERFYPDEVQFNDEGSQSVTVENKPSA